MIKLNLMAVGLAALALASCSKSQESLDSLIEYSPVQEDKNGRWGFVGKDGEILISDEYKEKPSPVINGVFYVKEGSGYSLYKAGKKPELIKNGDELYTVGYLMEGVIPVSRKGERISLINENGETVATLDPVKGKEIVAANYIFEDGLLSVVDEDHKIGFVNTKGEMVIPPTYDKAGGFAEGLCVVGKGKKLYEEDEVFVMETVEASRESDGLLGEEKKDDEEPWKVSVINKKGEEVFSLKNSYEPITGRFKDGYLAIEDGDRYGFVNKEGEMVIKLPGKVNRIGDYNSKYVTFRSDNGWGVMKMNEEDQEIIVKDKYDNIQIAKNDKFVATKDDDKYSLINSKGEKEFDFDSDYKLVLPINDAKFDYIGYDQNRRAILLDSEGKPLKRNQEFNNIAIRVSGMDIVSNYFNTEGFVQDLLMPITDKGMGRYYIGEPASQLGLNKDDYHYTSRFNNRDYDTKAFNYEIEFLGETDGSIVTSDWDYDSYEYVYSFNSYSNVESLILSGSTKDDHWKDIRTKLYEGLKAKGFNLDKEGNESATFSNSNVKIYVSGNEYGVTLTMMAIDSNIFPTDAPQKPYFGDPIEIFRDYDDPYELALILEREKMAEVELLDETEEEYYDDYYY